MQPVSAKNFYASVQRDLIEPLGLKLTGGPLTTPDDTEKIDFAAASFIVLSLVKDHGMAVYQQDSLANQLAQKVGQRLSESWQKGEIDLGACKLAIDEVKASIDQSLKETARQTVRFLQAWACDTENCTVGLRLMQLESLLGLANASAKETLSENNKLVIEGLTKLLNSVEDFNELAVCVTKLKLLRPQIDQVLGKASQGNLERLITQAHTRLSDRVKEGLEKWVNQTPSEQEKAARQEAAEEILISLNSPQNSTLCLNVWELTSLPAEIGALGHLQQLRLCPGKLESLPGEIGLLGNLKLLNLSNNNLQSLPEAIGGLTNLQQLYLGSNQLQSLPDSIGLLGNLEVLDVFSNQLKSLPHSIGALSNVKTMDLTYNQLESLPEEIGLLSNLEVLNLMENQLKGLPHSIGALNKLRELVLFQNALQSLPNSISRLNLSQFSQSQIAELQASLGVL